MNTNLNQAELLSSPKLKVSPVEIFDSLEVQQCEGERAKCVSIVRPSLCKPLWNQVVQVGTDEGFHTPVAQFSGHTGQHLW